MKKNNKKYNATTGKFNEDEELDRAAYTLSSIGVAGVATVLGLLLLAWIMYSDSNNSSCCMVCYYLFGTYNESVSQDQPTTQGLF